MNWRILFCAFKGKTLIISWMLYDTYEFMKYSLTYIIDDLCYRFSYFKTTVP